MADAMEDGPVAGPSRPGPTPLVQAGDALASTSEPDMPPASPLRSSDDIGASMAGQSAEQRVSFYVQVAEEMISTVMAGEAYLFSPGEAAALKRWLALPYESRYLFVRLYLRKSKWIRVSGIGYENDIADVRKACEALCKLVSSPVPSIKGKEKEKDPNVVYIDDSDDEEEQVKQEELDLSRFALDAGVLEQRAFSTPDDVLNLLSMEELSALGRKMNVKGKKSTRFELTEALLRSSTQATLSFFPSTSKQLFTQKEKENSGGERAQKRRKSDESCSPSPSSSSSEGKKGSTASFGLQFDDKGKKVGQSRVVITHALKIIGPCIRLAPDFLTLFARLSLIYYRVPSIATDQFTFSLLSRFGIRKYPDYTVGRSWSIFEGDGATEQERQAAGRQRLKDYEAAMQKENEMEVALGEDWTPSGKSGSSQSSPSSKKGPLTQEEKREIRLNQARDAIAIWDSIKERWRGFVEAESARLVAAKESTAKHDISTEGLLYYRKRFHPGWPLTRIAYKAVACYAKLGDHEAERLLLKELLAQNAFRRGKRGEWYERLALVLMTYPNEKETDEEDPKKKAEMKTKRLQKAQKVCEKGLRDEWTHMIYHSSLQRRLLRLESLRGVAKEDRTDFPVLLNKASVRVMEGERLDSGDVLGVKSVWRLRDGSEGNVEELALEGYRIIGGWKGFHSENGILTTIFSLLMWDVLFAPVDGVFETAYQRAPLDLATDAFAVVRAELLKKRLREIREGQAPKLLETTDDRERPSKTTCIGVRWDQYSKEDLLEIVECLGGKALAVICRVLAEEWGYRVGGIPDLCLWNYAERKVMFSEVKGPGDRLSETQNVWIDVLLQAGVAVETCRVMTSWDKEKEEQGGSAKKGKKRGKAKVEEDEDELHYSE